MHFPIEPTPDDPHLLEFMISRGVSELLRKAFNLIRPNLWEEPFKRSNYDYVALLSNHLDRTQRAVIRTYENQTWFMPLTVKDVLYPKEEGKSAVIMVTHESPKILSSQGWLWPDPHQIIADFAHLTAMHERGIEYSIVKAPSLSIFHALQPK